MSWLTRRPAHPATTEYMHMDMINSLASAFVAIENQAVAVLIDALVGGYLFCHQHHTAGYADIFIVEIINRRNVLFRYNQNMRRRLRINIPESQDVFVLINLVTRNFTVSDFAKQAICHRAPHVVFGHWILLIIHNKPFQSQFYAIPTAAGILSLFAMQAVGCQRSFTLTAIYGLFNQG